MKDDQGRGTAYAILAAALYAVSIPLSKLLLGQMAATMTAGFLYLGAGLGMTVWHLAVPHGTERPLDRSDAPYAAAMVALDIAAAILMMNGLDMAAAANVALLSNFEIVATAVIAFFFFHERITARLWLAIILVTVACGLLSLQEGSFSFSLGSLLVLAACVAWGAENNCTRRLSVKDPVQVTALKGLGTGLGSLVIGLAVGQRPAGLGYVLLTMVLGLVSYGFSVLFYIRGQRLLGAARTSTWYALSPFIAGLLSLILFGSWPGPYFLVAAAIMAFGAYLTTRPEGR